MKTALMLAAAMCCAIARAQAPAAVAPSAAAERLQEITVAASSAQKTCHARIHHDTYAFESCLLDLLRAEPRSGARRLDAFGSAVRDDFDPVASDLDFLVEFDDVPPATYAQAYFSLKEGLESLFGRPVDLVTSSGLENPFFRERIDAERRTVYAR